MFPTKDVKRKNSQYLIGPLKHKLTIKFHGLIILSIIRSDRLHRGQPGKHEGKTVLHSFVLPTPTYPQIRIQQKPLTAHLTGATRMILVVKKTIFRQNKVTDPP